MPALHGTTVAGFPNLFFLVGPNTGLGHTSIVYMIESQVALRAGRARRRWTARGLAAVEPRQEVQDAWNAELQERPAGHRVERRRLRQLVPRRAAAATPRCGRRSRCPSAAGSRASTCASTTTRTRRDRRRRRVRRMSRRAGPRRRRSSSSPAPPAGSAPRWPAQLDRPRRARRAARPRAAPSSTRVRGRAARAARVGGRRHRRARRSTRVAARGRRALRPRRRRRRQRRHRRRRAAAAGRTPPSYDRVIEVNLLGSVRTVRAFLPALVASRGYVLQVASLAAMVPAPLMSAYCASKSGVEAFAHSLRAELAHHGVDVGVAYLAWTDTAMVRGGRRRPRARGVPRGPAGAVRPHLPARPGGRAARRRRRAAGAARLRAALAAGDAMLRGALPAGARSRGGARRSRRASTGPAARAARLDPVAAGLLRPGRTTQPTRRSAWD